MNIDLQMDKGKLILDKKVRKMPLESVGEKNGALSYFKLGLKGPRSKISWIWDFWWLRKDSCFIGVDRYACDRIYRATNCYCYVEFEMWNFLAPLIIHLDAPFYLKDGLPHCLSCRCSRSLQEAATLAWPLARGSHLEMLTLSSVNLLMWPSCLLARSL